ncbi:hypothetical protein D9M70_600660 [compost metagenome]
MGCRVLGVFTDELASLVVNDEATNYIGSLLNECGVNFSETESGIVGDGAGRIAGGGDAVVHKVLLLQVHFDRQILGVVAGVWVGAESQKRKSLHARHCVSAMVALEASIRGVSSGR